MLGAIIGDIVGSIYEWDGIKTKDFDFFDQRCQFTDDTVCTAAVADILLHDLPPAATMQEWCRRYPGARLRRFFWSVDLFRRTHTLSKLRQRCGDARLARGVPAPRRFGGCAHRVRQGNRHHPQSPRRHERRPINHTRYLARVSRRDPAKIRKTISTTYGYDLTRTGNEIRPDYYFNETCQGTVPEAIMCALESESFEDAVRNAISLGGDADTLAAIAGPIAEALHGIPDEFKERADSQYLADAQDIREIMREMYLDVAE